MAYVCLLEAYGEYALSQLHTFQQTLIATPQQHALCALAAGVHGLIGFPDQAAVPLTYTVCLRRAWHPAVA